MKRSLAALTAVLLGALSAGSWAAGVDSADLTVTITNSVSVTVLDASYDFGPVALGAVTVNTAGIRIDNASGGIRQDYRLSLEDSAADGWSAAAAAGTDAYSLRALFAGSAPAPQDFTADDELSSTVTAADDAVFGPAGSAGCGLPASGCNVSDVAGTHERTLWLRLGMPTAVTAQPASPFATVWVSAIAG